MEDRDDECGDQCEVGVKGTCKYMHSYIAFYCSVIMKYNPKALTNRAL